MSSELELIFVQEHLKNKCELCMKRGWMNFEDSDYGIRCKKHCKKGMINISSKKNCEKRFIKRINELGGQVIGKYLGKDISTNCICKNKHDCNPRPHDILQGQGMCKTCSNKDPKKAEHNFILNIKKLGGRVIGEYLGKDIRVQCKNNHKCNPIPANVRRHGRGMCRICAQNDPEIAEKNFIVNIERLGGKIIGKYKGKDIRVQCICKNGHDCDPLPSSIRECQGMCNICSQSGCKF